MTFEWKSNEDCTELTCYMAEGPVLKLEGVVGIGWTWTCEYPPESKIEAIKRNELSLLTAMRAAQTAYLEHVKTEAVEPFQCYEVWRPNIPADGCKSQCKECAEQQTPTP